jgi:hypothetical protein
LRHDVFHLKLLVRCSRHLRLDDLHSNKMIRDFAARK